MVRTSGNLSLDELNLLIHLGGDRAILKYFSEHRNRLFKSTHVFVHIPEIKIGLRIFWIELDGGAE